MNAAGLAAGALAGPAGGATFRTWPRQGQYLLPDRWFGEAMRAVVGGVPTPHTRGVYVVPTTNGSCLLGPTARDHDDPHDRAVDAPTLEDVWARCAALVPSIPRDAIIKTYAANRPAADRVYRVEADPDVPGLIHAAATFHRDLVVASRRGARPRPPRRRRRAGRAPAGALDRLEPLPRLLHHPEPARLAARDPRYGQVVCACEHVSAAEIAAAFRLALPPASIDGVRRRTRATGGRCQGALCLAGTSFLLSVHGGIAPEAVPLGEPGLTLVLDRADDR